jgi:hypothetical protein
MRRALLIVGSVLVAACGSSPATSRASTTIAPPTEVAPTGAVPTETVAASAVPDPTPLPSATVFVSTQYGYSVTVPAGWTIVPAAGKWDGTSSVASDDPVVDQLVAPSVTNRCTKVFTCGPNAWAYAAAENRSLADFAAERVARDAADHPCPPAPESSEPATMAGVPALVQSKHCPAGADGQFVMAAFAVKDGVGYELYLEDRAHDPVAEPADRADFLALLASIVLPG